jgi:5'-nucleotidase
MKPQILLTNDDGIFAHGLKQLWNVLDKWASITIVAPSGQRSGCGTSLTFHKPIQLQKFNCFNNTEAWSVCGTPVDCVNIALNSLLKTLPALVISGINQGSNAGRSVLNSGTLGAVIESAMLGIPSIAFSYASHEPSDHYCHYLKPIIQYFLKHPPPLGTCININIPPTEIKSCRYARQGKGRWTDDIELSEKSECEYTATLSNGRFVETKEHSESDVALLSQGYITATPILVHDLTNFDHLSKHCGQFKSLIPDKNNKESFCNVKV